MGSRRALPSRGRFALRLLVVVVLCGQVGASASDRRSPEPAVAQQSLQQLFKDSSPAVVLIRQSKADGNVTSLGSGFVVSPSGVVVTNHHVIAPDEGAVQLTVSLPNGDEFTDVRVIYAESRRDFAVLSIRGSGLQALKVGDSDRVEVGDQVVAIGNPQGLTLTFTSGYVGSVRVDPDKGYHFIQHQAPISHGSSGGPLLNLQGEVIGINTFSFEDAQNLNGAVPINYVKPYFKDPATMTWQEYARPPARPTPPTPPPAPPPPSNTPPPPKPNSIDWTIINSCSQDVYLRFFVVDDKGNPLWFWPGSPPNGEVYVYKANDTRVSSLGNCEHDGSRKVCFGGQNVTDGKLVWGAGLDGKGACADCCAVCGVAKTTTLTCR